jgi:hypothetical protein
MYCFGYTFYQASLTIRTQESVATHIYTWVALYEMSPAAPEEVLVAGAVTILTTELPAGPTNPGENSTQNES